VRLLFFFIRVAEDDDLAVAEQPQKIAVELAKETLGELEVTSDIMYGIFLTTGAIPEGPPCSSTGKR
jgi:hypothetical protein